MRIQNGYSYFLMAHPLNISMAKTRHVWHHTGLLPAPGHKSEWIQCFCSDCHYIRVPVPLSRQKHSFYFPDWHLSFCFVCGCFSPSWLLLPLLSFQHRHTDTHTLPRMSCGRSYYQDIDRLNPNTRWIYLNWGTHTLCRLILINFCQGS